MIFKNFPRRIKKKQNSQEVKYEAFSSFALSFQGSAPFIKKKFFPAKFDCCRTVQRCINSSFKIVPHRKCLWIKREGENVETGHKNRSYQGQSGVEVRSYKNILSPRLYFLLY